MSRFICDSCGRTLEIKVNICGNYLGDRDICDGILREHKPAPKPRRLSIEECVYWLVVIARADLARLIINQDLKELGHWRAFFFARLRGHKNWAAPWRREAGTVAFLLGEALRELETKRPLSGKELSDRFGFQPLKPEEFESNVDREARRASRVGGQQ